MRYLTMFLLAAPAMWAQAPAPGTLVGGIARRTALEQIRTRGKADQSMSGLGLLRKVLGNYGKMLDETFESRMKLFLLLAHNGSQ